MTLFLCILSSTGTVFLYCYTGSLTTDQFLRYGDIAYESDWFLMPIEMQTYLILIIADAQRPLEFHGMRIINLNLATFASVMLAFDLDFFSLI